jgi:hypothetical protein
VKLAAERAQSKDARVLQTVCRGEAAMKEIAAVAAQLGGVVASFPAVGWVLVVVSLAGVPAADVVTIGAFALVTSVVAAVSV